MAPAPPHRHPRGSPLHRIPCSPSHLFIIHILLPLLLLTPLVQSQCFAPSGAPANNTPCYTDLQESFCCGAGYTCMSIKACQGPSTPDQGWYARGTCTTPDYSDAACPTFCRDEDFGFLTDIFACPDGTWCCQRQDKSGNACCGTSSLLFDLGLATTLGVVGPSGGLFSVNTAAQLAAQSTGVAASTAATSTGSSSTSSATPKGSRSSSTGSSPVQTAASADSGTSSASQTAIASAHNGLSKGTIAGAAVGSVAGFAAVLVLGIWIFLRQRRKIRALKGQIAKQQDEGGAGHAYAGGRPGDVNEMYAAPAEMWGGKGPELRSELEGQGRGAGKRMTRADGVELG